MAIAKKKDNPVREKLAQAIAAAKTAISRTQAELDAAGEERKELTPGMVDALREGIMAIYPNSEEEQTEATMQLIIEAISEAQPESDVDEERADGDDEEEEKADDEEEEKALIKVTKQLSEWSKGYNDLVGDMGGIVEVVGSIATTIQSEAKQKNEFDVRLKAIEKLLKQRPRRASQAEETELDSDSELGKAVDKQLFTAPSGYEDMFSKGGSN